METPNHFFKGGGELVDYPGCYKIDGATEDGSNSWSVVRKPDGTWWWVRTTSCSGQIVSRDRRFRCATQARQERGIGRRTLAAA